MDWLLEDLVKIEIMLLIIWGLLVVVMTNFWLIHLTNFFLPENLYVWSSFKGMNKQK